LFSLPLNLRHHRSSLPAILKLFLLWIVLFLFFGIAYTEVFGLTRWNLAETHNENYRSLANALVMLAFMSTGYVSGILRDESLD
jgi:hypothetical protein